MNTLLCKFLPNAIVDYTIHTNNSFYFPYLKIRPFRSAIVACLNTIKCSLDTEDPIVTCDLASLFFKLKWELKHITYIIHKELHIREINVNIGGLGFCVKNLRVLFDDSITITIDEIAIGQYIVCKRFDRYVPIKIQFIHSEIIIKIPEVRIYQNPPLRLIMNFKRKLQSIVPDDDNDAPLPKIHMSSIFVRHVPTSWVSCISPISIGFNYTSIWEIWEHVVRAITRI